MSLARSSTGSAMSPWVLACNLERMMQIHTVSIGSGPSRSAGCGCQLRPEPVSCLAARTIAR